MFQSRLSGTAVLLPPLPRSSLCSCPFWHLHSLVSLSCPCDPKQLLGWRRAHPRNLLEFTRLGSGLCSTAVFLAGAGLCTGEELVTWQIPSLLRCLGFVRKVNKLSTSALLWRALTKQIPGK